jgi:hypothetical protein
VERIPFEVVQTLQLRGRVYVIVQALTADCSQSLNDATLGGCAIEPWTDIPRSLKIDGELRLDRFAFVLRHSEDEGRFAPGQLVDLVTR